MKYLSGFGVFAAAVVLSAGMSMTSVYAADRDENLIEENIYVGGVDVGGLDERSAVSKVREYVDGLKDTEFTLDYEGNTCSMTAGEMDLTWVDEAKVSEAVGIGKTGNLIDRYKIKKDLEHENIKVDITLTVDEDKVKDLIKERLSVYDVEPENYGLKRENGEFIITEGNTGMKIDAAASADTVVNYMLNDWDRESTETFEMTVKITEPESKKEDLEKVKDVLGTFTTDFSTSGAGRAQNVKNGASKINGTVLYPGEELSVYDLVNPMTAENGYELAGSYENGTTVQTYGGGICQVSSTLYNAAIRAEMRIEERYCHSMIVSYVQPSMDAAIAGTYKNLRFANPYNYPVYVEGYTYGGQITFTIYGYEERPSNRKVTFESETLSSITPELQINTTGDAIGYVATVQSAHEGKSACLWKVVTVDGVEESREIFNRSTYNASPKIIAVGLGSDDPEAVAQMQAAIATRDEGTIRAKAAELAAAAAAPAEEEGTQDDESSNESSEGGSSDNSSSNDSSSSDDSSSSGDSDSGSSSDDSSSSSESSSDSSSNDVSYDDASDGSDDEIIVDPDAFED